VSAEVIAFPAPEPEQDPEDRPVLVLDLGDPACVEQLAALRRRLEEKGVTLVAEQEPTGDPFRLHLSALLLASKSERFADPEAELEAFRQLAGHPFPAFAVSAETGHGLPRLGPILFDMLGVVRVYTKLPGHPADRSRPFTVRRDGTVRDVARLVHRGLAAELKFARLWGSGKFDGEQVSASHPVRDGDVVELHG